MDKNNAYTIVQRALSVATNKNNPIEERNEALNTANEIARENGLKIFYNPKDIPTAEKQWFSFYPKHPRSKVLNAMHNIMASIGYPIRPDIRNGRYFGFSYYFPVDIANILTRIYYILYNSVNDYVASKYLVNSKRDHAYSCRLSDIWLEVSKYNLETECTFYSQSIIGIFSTMQTIYNALKTIRKEHTQNYE